VSVVIAALVDGGVGARFHDGPIGPFTDGALVSCESVATPVSDWTFATPIQTLELEVVPDHPHSVTTWLLVVDGVCFVQATRVSDP
jgi:hypothetical protein